MSAPTSARRAPRVTARLWCTIISRVTGTVVSHPRITVPRESPTNRTSMPARSSRAAMVAS